MRLSCEVIKDLLPLYHDKVCSKESSFLIEEHLAECSQCSDELQKIKASLEKPNDLDGGIKVMENISARWKRDRRVSFTKGSMIVSILATATCLVAYNIIGAEVLPDGTLVEPFALIPIAYIFFLIFIISLIFNIIFSKKNRSNK